MPKRTPARRQEAEDVARAICRFLVVPPTRRHVDYVATRLQVFAGILGVGAMLRAPVPRRARGLDPATKTAMLRIVQRMARR